MKKNVIFLVSLMVSWGAIAADIPDNYNLSCWDHTFLYNELEVMSQGNNLKFTSHGHDFLYEKLLPVQFPLVDFAYLTMEFIIPRSSCSMSSQDSKIVGCRADKLVINFIGLAKSGDPVNQSVEVKDINIALQKVVKVFPTGKEVTGYEFHIVDKSLPVATGNIFSQNYFNGLGADETQNCELK